MKVLVPSTYLGPVSYYALLYAAEAVAEERCEHYVKQTYRNRCRIATPQGPIALTLPVEHTPGRATTAQMALSAHGNWQHVHWNALVSAYESSPYFEFYADDFRPFYEAPPSASLTDFNDGLRRVVCQLLELEPPLVLTTAYASAPPEGWIDLRRRLTPKLQPLMPTPVYYQVFAAQTGFQPDLSIVDLLFNLGPEARLVLRQAARTWQEAGCSL